MLLSTLLLQGCHSRAETEKNFIPSKTRLSKQKEQRVLPPAGCVRFLRTVKR